MPGIDRSYKPRIWRCEECRAILGIVLRDSDRCRRLWVLRVQRQATEKEPAVSEKYVFDSAESVRQDLLWRVRALDSGTIGCDFCGSLQEWYPTKEILREFIQRLRGDAGLKEFDRLMKSEKV